MLSIAFFVAAVVGLHFTGMAAYTFTPMVSGAPIADTAAYSALAIAIGGVSAIIAATGIISFIIDTTASEEMVQRLLHLAACDALTGLPNRVRFAEHIDVQIAVSRAKHEQLAVIGIDLDQFKDINDLHGHGAGDTVLKALAGRLSGMLKDGEFVARIGGDEFAATKSFTHKSELIGFFDRLKEAFFTPVAFNGGEATTGASCGVAIFPVDGETAHGLSPIPISPCTGQRRM